MPIDPSIILGVKAPQFTTPQELYAQKAQFDQNELANRLGGLKLKEFEDGQAEKNALKGVYSQFGNDSAANVNLLYKAGLGKAAGDYAKSAADTAKEKALGNKTQIESLQKVNGIVGSAAYALSQNPNLTYQDVLGTVEQLKGQLPAEFHGALDVSKLPQDPVQLRTALQGLYTKSIETDKLLADATSRRNNDQTNQTSRDNNTATNQTSRDNNRATVGASYYATNKADARAREANQNGKIPPGYRAKADGTLEAIPGGPADLKINAAGVAKVSDAKDVLGLLDEVDKILPNATGSYSGVGTDAALGAIGISTGGAKATAQLKALQGALISKMPKMSGPQSDKDVQLYREMAGQVGDPTVPRAQRQAAADMVRKLNEKYAGMTPGASKASPNIESLLDKYK